MHRNGCKRARRSGALDVGPPGRGRNRPCRHAVASIPGRANRALDASSRVRWPALADYPTIETPPGSWELRSPDLGEEALGPRARSREE